MSLFINPEKEDPELINTYWGYRLTSADEDQVFTRFGRLLGRFIGVLLFLIIAGIWSFSAATFSDPVMLTMKTGLTTLLFVFGWSLYSFGQDASYPETQVDFEKRELRVGQCDRSGRFSLASRLSFDKVGEILMLPSHEDSECSSLYARIGHGMEAVHVLSGEYSQLEPVQTRLIEDLTIVENMANVRDVWKSLTDGAASDMPQAQTS